MIERHPQLETPVLFLIFNRPEPTARVFEAIRGARPKKLFVAADGPRPNKPSDAAACRATRAIIEQVDWPCEVQTLFREENLGCKAAVSSAISWFFERASEGVILEDDCLPDPSFFPYCAELLERYRDDARVMLVSGSLLAESWPGDGSYFASKYANIWGWASWKRAWSAYDGSMTSWASERARAKARARIGSERAWRAKAWGYERAYSGRKDSWAYPWEFAVLAADGISIVPRVNLVQNIGAGTEATHAAQAKAFSFPTRSVRIPLSHPDALDVDERYDHYFIKKVFIGRTISMRRIMNLFRRIGRSAGRWTRRAIAPAIGIRYIRPIPTSPLYYLIKGDPRSLGLVVDVGCGFDADFSMHMIERHRARAIGIDPTRKHAEPLRKLAAAHAGSFSHVPLALSGTKGTISFNESIENVSGSVIEEHRNIHDQRVNRYEVESCDLASLPQRLGIDRIPYIKLDLEGAEYGLIDAMRPGDLDAYGQLFVEFHHHAIPRFKESDTRKSVEKIRGLGFRSFTVNGRDYIFYR